MQFVAILVVALSASDGGLLLNCGFESVRAGTPAHWDVFVMPQPGAVARADEVHRHGGQYSAMLHTVRPYKEEPFNNWSQSVLRNVAGKTLELRGFVRTKDATEAAIWVQCWQGGPARVLHVASTALNTPVTGTKEWTAVRTLVEAPLATDFIMVRCVLRGMGTAWFDDVTLSEETWDDVDRFDMEAVVPGRRDDEAGRTAETIRRLRAENRGLSERIVVLEKELEVLRGQMTRTGMGVQNLPRWQGAMPLMPLYNGGKGLP